MTAFIDLTGQRFGKWTMLARAPSRGRRTMFYARCDCGTEKIVGARDVANGQSTNCGCVRKESVRRIRQTHGCARTPMYEVWKGMKARCENPGHRSYKNYGGRGVYVCERWQSFENFLADVGQRPPGMTLDRINNDGPYAPDNWRWATPREQTRNSRTMKYLEFNGKRLCVTDWAKQLGISRHRLWARLQSDWPVERIFSEKQR